MQALGSCDVSMALRRFSVIRVLCLMVISSFFVSIYLAMHRGCNCADIDEMAVRIQDLQIKLRESDRQLAQSRKAREQAERRGRTNGDDDAYDDDDESLGPHKLAVVVPFRERFEELMEFVPYMHKFLNMQRVRHNIYIVNQMDNLRFNRASLINIGFLLSKTDCDYMVMHDVDLLPRNKDLSYSYERVMRGPHHIAAPEIHPRYHYKTFIGGILMLKREHYAEVNGMSNKFWGWGREDDEFYHRLTKANLQISKPEGITTGPEDTFYHIHDGKKRKRDMTRLHNQKQEQFKKDSETGVETIDYKLLSRQTLRIEGALCTVLHVSLKCDKEVTPWCEYEAS
ncbi:beta-1,4-galactosyltransferase 7-like [Diadema antillarum]|uniref:beta-1,4-galactosyltransferase 7-like n=1 Tax=Diadema antillarum TaxID=105358 RepID=UPI003A8388AC